jgi:hypothetical protein
MTWTGGGFAFPQRLRHVGVMRADVDYGDLPRKIAVAVIVRR